MEPLCRACVEQAAEAVRRCSDGTSEAERARRNAWAWVLHVAPLVNREARDVIRQEALYPYLVWYERTRLHWCASTWFLDGLPDRLVVFGEASPVTMPTADLDKLDVHHVVDDRLLTIVKLEGINPDSDRAAQLAAAYPVGDMPPDAPISVRVFAYRARAMNNGMRDVKPPHMFPQCGNAACSRLFMAEPRRRGENSHAYMLALGQPCESDHLQHRFCCRACARDWCMQRDRAGPVVDTNALAVTLCSKRDSAARGRAAHEFRGALKRNRRLRDAVFQKRARGLCAIGKGEMRELRRGWVRALNLDTAMLYLGRLLSDSRTTFGEGLPGAAPRWRESASSVHLAQFLSRIHPDDENMPDEALIVDEFGSSRLLQRVKRNALTALSVAF